MSRQNPTQLGVCSWSLKPASAEDLIVKLRQLGLSKLQLSLNPVSEGDPAWIAIGRLCKDAGVSIVSGMFHPLKQDYSTPASIRKTGGFVPDETWDGNWKIVEETAATAKKLGLRDVSTHVGFIPEDRKDPTYDKLLDRLARIADRFAKDGLVLLFETGQESADTLLAFLKALDRKNVGANFDPANMILYDMGEPVASLRKLMPWVRQCHLKDARKTTEPGKWGPEVPIGQGQVNWRGFFDVLNEHKYDGALVIERESGTSRMDDVRTGADYVRGLMAPK